MLWRRVFHFQIWLLNVSRGRHEPGELEFRPRVHSSSGVRRKAYVILLVADLQDLSYS